MDQLVNANRFFDEQEQRVGVRLSEVQQQAARHAEGPMLLLASPGSGKTTTLIMRIGYLIAEQRVAPERIKAMTFSRAAAREMKERFAAFFPHLPTPAFSTIHSFAYEVVRNSLNRKGTPYQIIEGEAQQTASGQARGQEQAAAGPVLHKKVILRMLYRRIADTAITDDQLEELATYMSLIKNKLLGEAKRGSVKPPFAKARQVMDAYEAYKLSGHSCRLLDFDDLVVLCHQLLQEDEHLLAAYQRRYDYVLADESQDTSLVQHRIIAMLAARHQNLYLVADDDQSIYSWRGAEPGYLLKFGEMYPQAKLLYMEQNYRSTRSIVELANRFISRNKARYPKKMFTSNEADEPVRALKLPDYRDQSSYIVDAIRDLGEQGSVAVLYRNNVSAVAIINALEQAGIPFYMRDTDMRFFSHWVVKDILNFMRMSYTDKRVDLLERIHTKLSGYITKQQVAHLSPQDTGESVFDRLIASGQLRSYQIELLREVKHTFRQMRDMPPLPAIRVIRERLGYQKALEGMCEKFGFRMDELSGILQTLEEIAEPLETMEQFARRLQQLEAACQAGNRRKHSHAVTLSTFHSAKGMEFDTVYMIDLIDAVIPGRRDHIDGEEPARLFYVGMTRAKRRLVMIGYGKRDGHKVAVSPYLSAVRDIMRESKAKSKSKGKGKPKSKEKGSSKSGK